MNLVRDLLGDHGLHTPTETLLAKQYDSANSFDLARLKGARMVTAIETNWNRQINEAMIKAMTGGDPLTARHLYHDFFQFMPEFKLWFAVNDFPKVRGTAGAFWRRVRVIPFQQMIAPEDSDDRLTAKLKAELPGSWHGRFGVACCGDQKGSAPAKLSNGRAGSGRRQPITSAGS